MQVTQIAASEIDASLTRRWHALQAHPDHPEWLHPFLSPEFARITGEIRPRSRVALVEDAGRLVGLWAYEALPGGLALPLARHMSDLQGLLMAPEADDPLPWLVKACGLRCVRFDHVLPRTGLQPALVSASMRTGWMIDLSEGFEAYRMVQARQSRWWRRAAGKARRLSEALGPLSWQDDVRDDEAWRMLARWKSEQYRQSGLRDNFAIAWVRQWLECLRWSDAPALQGTLQSLRAGDRLVAVHFGVRGHHILHHYLPAYDHALALYSPGSVLLEQTLRQAPGQGLSLIDMSTGDLEYKQAVSNLQRSLATGMMAPAWLGRMATQMQALERWLRQSPGLLPVARRSRRAFIQLVNGPAGRSGRGATG
ncbi:MAG: hypothetical protein RLZ51_1628 [Pseudomonadota bacterium]|jgi:CelD/BcsL family acetyltransferase involved in cellulose biosynthesis